MNIDLDPYEGVIVGAAIGGILWLVVAIIVPMVFGDSILETQF